MLFISVYKQVLVFKINDTIENDFVNTVNDS